MTPRPARAHGPRTVEGVYRFLLTPRWWGINVFVLLAIPFCVFMGSWQLGRFEDRVADHRTASDLAAEAETSSPRPLAELLPVDKATSGKQATATGRYGRQLLVPGRELDGERGYYVLTMLRTDGGALPVVRGWLPGDADPAKAPAAPTGEVTVTGALQASESPGSNGVSSAGGLPAGQTGAISSASLVNLVPYKKVYEAWITLDKADSGMKAVPAAAPQNTGLDLKAFQNLGYTGEWFVFAGFVVFMWFRLLRREVEFARDAELGIVPEGAGSGSESGAGSESGIDGESGVPAGGGAPASSSTTA